MSGAPDPVQALQLMRLSDVQLERACAARFIEFWQRSAVATEHAQRAATFGMVFTFVMGLFSGAAYSGGDLPGWAVLACLAVAIPSGALCFAGFRRHLAMVRELPDPSVLEPILAEMRRRAGTDTGQPVEALREA